MFRQQGKKRRIRRSRMSGCRPSPHGRSGRKFDPAAWSATGLRKNCNIASLTLFSGDGAAGACLPAAAAKIVASRVMRECQSPREAMPPVSEFALFRSTLLFRCLQRPAGRIASADLAKSPANYRRISQPQCRARRQSAPPLDRVKMSIFCSQIRRRRKICTFRPVGVWS